ncbi:bacitracin resistance protein [Agromyces seonyuensis]|uniref:Bacitracin resistance protein n=1 Tax=Agromyces seonyuensis TaxID=2662446 RepID=A0A6I4P0M5_9MICO|nr:bacitracin resistance protein [Agromyces seonyuensis]MWB99911.1 bacitracin resistance protein [Agromyces seonyuensis]
MSDDRSTVEAPVADPVPAAPFRPTWLVLAISILFGLFFAWDAWEAVGNFLSITQYYVDGLGGTITVLGWFVYLGSILLPIVIFAAALWLTRRRSVWQLAVVMFAGLCLSAALWLDIIARANPVVLLNL